MSESVNLYDFLDVLGKVKKLSFKKPDEASRREQMRYYYGEIFHQSLLTFLEINYNNVFKAIDSTSGTTVKIKAQMKGIEKVLRIILEQDNNELIAAINREFGVIPVSSDTLKFDVRNYDIIRKGMDGFIRYIDPKIAQVIVTHATSLDPTNPITYIASAGPTPANSADTSETAPPATATTPAPPPATPASLAPKDEKKIKGESGFSALLKRGAALAQAIRKAYQDPNAELKPIPPAGVAVASGKAGTQAVAGGGLEPIKAQKKIRGKKHNINDFKEAKADLRKTLDAGFDKNALEELDCLEREVLNGGKAPITTGKAISLALKPMKEKMAIAEKALDTSIGARISQALHRNNNFVFESNSVKMKRIFDKRRSLK